MNEPLRSAAHASSDHEESDDVGLVTRAPKPSHGVRGHLLAPAIESGRFADGTRNTFLGRAQVASSSLASTLCPANDLMRRVTRHDPTVVSVSLSEVVTMTIVPGTRRQVFAHALDGGVAVAVVSAHADGRRDVTFSHLPRSPAASELERVREALRRQRAVREGAIGHRAFVVAGCDWVRDATGCWNLAPSSPAAIEELGSRISEHLGRSNVKVLLYQGNARRRSNAFILGIRAISGGSLEWSGVCSGVHVFEPPGELPAATSGQEVPITAQLDEI